VTTGRRGWLERWDERNQRVLERQEAKRRAAAESPPTIWVTGPTGQRYRVVIDRSGYPFRARDWWLYVADLGCLAAALVEPIHWLRHRLQFRRGWSVGVLRPRQVWFDQLVHLERLDSKARAASRRQELLEALADKGATALRH
jgi:hypothetical protein